MLTASEKWPERLRAEQAKRKGWFSYGLYCRERARAEQMRFFNKYLLPPIGIVVGIGALINFILWLFGGN